VIERINERIQRILRGASSSETFEVTVEQGNETVKPRVGPRQIESSVPFSKWVETDPQPKTIRVADQLSQDAAPLAPDAVVKIGNVTIAPSTISGWEARLTRGWTAYDVTLDGKPVKGDQALEALYNSLREIQSAPKGKAK